MGTIFLTTGFQVPSQPEYNQTTAHFQPASTRWAELSITDVQASPTASAGHTRHPSPPPAPTPVLGTIWGGGCWYSCGGWHGLGYLLMQLPHVFWSCLASNPVAQSLSHVGLLLGLPEFMTLWVWQNPDRNGQYQTHGYLVSYNQEFCLYSAPLTHQELFFKKHINFRCRWHGLVPKCQRSVLAAPTQASPMCHTASFPVTNPSNSIGFARSSGPSSRVACIAALTSCSRPHSKQGDLLVTHYMGWNTFLDIGYVGIIGQSILPGILFPSFW